MALVIGSVPRGFSGPGDALVIPLPPKNGGAIGWGDVFLSFASDFATVVRLRIAVWNDQAGYWNRIIDSFDVPKDGGRVNLLINEGDSKVSVYRVSSGPDDPSGDAPVGWMLETTLRQL